jgi:hypothetical protein
MNFLRAATFLAAAGTALFVAAGIAAADTGGDSSTTLMRGFVLPYLVLLVVTGTLAAIGISRMASRRKRD